MVCCGKKMKFAMFYWVNKMSLYSLCLNLVASQITDASDLPSDLHDDLRKHMTKERQIELFNGEYKEWWSNGQLWEHCFYNQNGELNGECKEWFSDGRLWIHGFFQNGKGFGYNKWFNNGQLQVHFDQNSGEAKRWWCNGQLWKHGFYNQTGKLHGEFEEWTENGELMMQCFYKNGTLHGELKKWWKNGMLMTHCFYKNDKKHGEYKKWFYNGEGLNKHRFYEHGHCIKLHLNYF